MGRPTYSSGLQGARNPFDRDDHASSACSDLLAILLRLLQSLVTFAKGRGLQQVTVWSQMALRQLKRNLTLQRLLCVPHMLVIVWLFVMLQGERWIFAGRVSKCEWSNWEKWPEGANPHHLVFVADPQLIDPHSYPGRPWPFSDLTVLLTDNYLRRGYKQLQTQLQPDSVFFLGDLFDGGREWKTAHGDFEDAAWARPHPKGEQKYIGKWNKKYGEDFWLREYLRFSNIFFKPYDDSPSFPGVGQRGRKVVASLPGNHDLGFGSLVKVPVRNRFSAYFGEPNRVDIVGNHTFVSVDTVSLSAGSSSDAARADLRHIYGPAQEFLDDIQNTKKRAIERELRFWNGQTRESSFSHDVIDIQNTTEVEHDTGSTPDDVPVNDFPTILLTHVPLYRDPGTPCGPMREHWPPTVPPPTDDSGNVVDHRNAIHVSAGYQYQNVLGEGDSVSLIKTIGNVVHVFSGDDHDYCEVIHSASKENVPEITVKSMSMAMGVSLPGFLMVSLYNPVDEHGRPLPRAAEEPSTTLQTHLCLLPKQLNTYMGYIWLLLVSLIILLTSSILMTLRKIPAFALEPEATAMSNVLPLHKEKKDDNDYQTHHGSASSGTYSLSNLPARSSSLKATRPRDSPGPSSSPSQGPIGSLSPHDGPRRSHSKRSSDGSPHPRWASHRSPRIDIHNHGLATTDAWRPAGGARRKITVKNVWREFVAQTWRVLWMALVIWGYLTYSG